MIPAASTDYVHGSYLNPNESYPERAIPIFSRANGGAYISVGSERSFIGAALSNADRLILVDRDPTILRFNRLNAALLRIANNRQDFLNLRVLATPEEWARRAQALPLDSPIRALLSDRRNWEWWINNVRNNPKPHSWQWNFDVLHGTVDTHWSRERFQRANYLQDDALFERLHRLAQTDRIESHLFDISDRAAVRNLVSALRRGQQRVGILDFSNIWNPLYLDPVGVARVTHSFHPALAPDSILLCTQVISGTYRGFTIDYLDRSGNYAQVLRRAHDRDDQRVMVTAANPVALFNDQVPETEVPHRQTQGSTNTSLLPHEPLPNLTSTEYQSGYVRPNEIYPEEGIPIFSRGNRGTYISVGTERGFIGAALSQSDRLVLVDMDPNVVRFNRINIALLQLAHNREDYVRLRAQATPAEWYRRALSLPVDHPGRALLLQRENWQWWLNNVRIDPGGVGVWNFDLFHGRPNPYIQDRFQRANYTQDEALFARLQTLARQNRIESHLINLNDEAAVQRLVQAMQRNHARISILDISNVLYPGYLEPDGVARLVENCRGAMVPDSILLLTGRGGRSWSYNGITHEYLQRNGNPTQVISAIYRMTYTRHVTTSLNGETHIPVATQATSGGTPQSGHASRGVGLECLRSVWGEALRNLRQWRR